MELLWLWILLGFVSLFLIGFISIVLITNKILKKTYYKRCDGIPTIRYPVADHFDGLKCKKSYFLNREKLRLYSYTYFRDIKKHKGLILFVHGIGCGHSYALPLINYLTEQGYIVYAYDQYACGSSEGKIMGSMYHGLSDIKYALRDIENNREFDKYDIFVVGHSWGGWVASLSWKYSTRVKKIVDISGMDSEAMMAPKGVGLFCKLRNFFVYGKLAFWTTTSSFKKTSAKIYYLQGICDVTVNPKLTGLKYKSMFANYDNIKVDVLPNKGHTPYIDSASQVGQNNVLKQFGFLGGNLVEMQPRIVFTALSKPDLNVYNKIVNFLDN